MNSEAQLKKQIEQLEQFVANEKAATLQQLESVWLKNLDAKLSTGQTQAINNLELLDKNSIKARLGDNESRYREGDIVRLYLDDPLTGVSLTQARIEAVLEDEWLLRVHKINTDSFRELQDGCFADPCFIDLEGLYQKALNEVATLDIGRTIILPLLAGQLENNLVDEDLYDEAMLSLEHDEFNDQQRDAIALGFSAEHLACIQGPPGTGKTRVIAKIAQLLAAKGERILLTSHTHMAINNALNKIKPLVEHTVKIGSLDSCSVLSPDIERFTHGESWKNMPGNGYVIGATPFATCTRRLEDYSFDTVIFDEASQITLPLAIMAMRTGTRFVFVGDHKQLPPVVLSNSILDNKSAFSALIRSNDELAVMLDETYRMNQWLTDWPSRTYYQSALKASGVNKTRRFPFSPQPGFAQRILAPEHSLVYIPSPGTDAKNKNEEEALLVKRIILAALDAGLDCSDIGVVVPFRLHGKNIRQKLHKHAVGPIVVDTVERMQGQEMELVILSLCSTAPDYLQALADFMFAPERINVSITRAKSKLVIIGPEPDMDDFASASADTRRLIQQYQSLIASASRQEQTV